MYEHSPKISYSNIITFVFIFWNEPPIYPRNTEELRYTTRVKRHNQGQ